MWPYDEPTDFLDPDEYPAAPPPARERLQAEHDDATVQLRAAMGHIAELRAHRRSINEELRTMHRERQHSWHLMDGTIDAVRQEARLAVIAEIDRREAEVRAELDAAHARAVADGARPRTLAEAQRQLVDARSGENLARERLQAAYAEPGRLQERRRHAAVLAIGAALGWLVVALIDGAWLIAGLGLLVVGAVAAWVIRSLERRIVRARDEIAAAVRRHESALHDLLTAEAAVVARGGELTS